MDSQTKLIDFISYGVIILFQGFISFFIYRAMKDHDILTELKAIIEGIKIELRDIKKRMDKWDS